MMPEESRLGVGRTIGTYRIDAELGSGGMGAVYRAYDLRLRRTVALKVLAGEESAAARARILREARAAAALSHPHICTVHEVVDEEERSCLVMEHVEGRTLRDTIPSGGLPVHLAIRYGSQIADALAHAHARGIVHADLKSPNVMVSPDGQVKVLDFGLARLAPGVDAATHSASDTLEGSGIAGTLPYLAPEVLQGRRADARSDIWALGVILHETASGVQPFTGSTPFALSAAILERPAQPLPAHTPPGFASVIARCLAKEPDARYQRADAVRAALDALLAASGPVPGTAAAPAARRRRMAALRVRSRRPPSLVGAHRIARRAAAREPHA